MRGRGREGPIEPKVEMLTDDGVERFGKDNQGRASVGYEQREGSEE